MSSCGGGCSDGNGNNDPDQNGVNKFPHYPGLKTHVGDGTRKLLLVDVNSDGYQDLLVPNNLDNQLHVRLGKGTQEFPTFVAYSIGNGPLGLIIGDFNKDGKIDVATVNNVNSSVSILSGNGTFQPVGAGARYITSLIK